MATTDSCRVQRRKATTSTFEVFGVTRAGIKQGFPVLEADKLTTTQQRPFNFNPRFAHTTNLQQTLLKPFGQKYGVQQLEKVENIVVKEEIARLEQFLLLP